MDIKYPVVEYRIVQRVNLNPIPVDPGHREASRFSLRPLRHLRKDDTVDTCEDF